MLKWTRVTWQNGELPPYHVKYVEDEGRFEIKRVSIQNRKFRLLDMRKGVNGEWVFVETGQFEKENIFSLYKCKKLAEDVLRKESELYDLIDLVELAS